MTIYKQTCTNLLELSSAKVKEWMASFDSVITDCDGKWAGRGCVWRRKRLKLRYIKICLYQVTGQHQPKYVSYVRHQSNRALFVVGLASPISMSKSEVRDKSGHVAFWMPYSCEIECQVTLHRSNQ